MAKKRKDDWRSLPRKPASRKRDRPFLVRFTAGEYERIQAAATEAQQTMSDWIVIRCLGKNAR